MPCVVIPPGILAVAALVAVIRCDPRDLPKIVRYLSGWDYRNRGDGS
jgi:hypothetical protein